MALLFEYETCSRCGGSGSYSYCQRYGTVCFKCSGARETLTARGSEAQRYLNELLSLPLSAIKPGMTVRDINVTVGGTPFHEWCKVIAITPYDASHNRSLVNGVMVSWEGEFFTMETETKRGRSSHCGLKADHMFRVLADKETKQAAIEKALAYQETLTKAGKPRKRA